MNNTFEIGKKLVDFCKQGKDLEAIETRLPTVKSCKKSFSIIWVHDHKRSLAGKG